MSLCAIGYVKETAYVMRYVKCVYAIKKNKGGFSWTIEFLDGSRQDFDYTKEEDAAEVRRAFLIQLENYWISTA